MQDVHDILGILAKATGLSVETIRFGNRLQYPAHVRAVAAWLIRHLTGASLAWTGVCLGGKDHSTIRASCLAVDKDIRDAGPRLDVLLRFIERTGRAV
jgi:chromosomal replication initiation ATPase DnaA